MHWNLKVDLSGVEAKSDPAGYTVRADDLPIGGQWHAQAYRVDRYTEEPLMGRAAWAFTPVQAVLRAVREFDRNACMSGEDEAADLVPDDLRCRGSLLR